MSLHIPIMKRSSAIAVTRDTRSRATPASSDGVRALDDAGLARRIAAAASAVDAAAEGELYRRLAPRVRLYGLKHLRSEPAAADLVQQVLLTTIERLRRAELRDPAQLVSFVLGTCRMVVLEQRRGGARRKALLEQYGDALAPSESAAPDPDHERVAACLACLSERERTIIVMTFYDDVPADVLAAELGITAANVRVIRHRGLDRLRTCVHGGAS
jgi:RNA polymerase sigma-70 factor (ECF subfamily)